MQSTEARQGPSRDTGVLLVSVADAAARLGIGETTLYAIIRAGELRTVQLGRRRRRLVPVAELERYVAEQTVVGL